MNGRQLNESLGLKAQQALYREDGKWYHHLKKFPGVLFDKNGYLLFRTKDEYLKHPQLQHGQDLNIKGGISMIKGYLSFSEIKIVPTVSKLDARIYWNQFLENAESYFEKDEIFLSPVEKSEYKIAKVDDKGVRIERLSTKNSFETIGKVKFNTCIDRINHGLPLIRKGSIYEHVVEETAIVELLDSLDWSEDGRYIIYKSPEDPPLSEAVGSTLQKVNQMITLRKGQKKLREKLFKLYNGKCVVTKSAIEEVLHACHIEPHAKNGNNLSENAILLRADIHELFDADLIAINPKTGLLEVHKLLEGTIYWPYHLKPISERNDRKELNSYGLLLRWDKFLKK